VGELTTRRQRRHGGNNENEEKGKDKCVRRVEKKEE
jgi:hypothetical protein